MELPEIVRGGEPQHRFRYSEAGAGTTVVLFNGIVANRALWQPLVDALADTYRVVTFDFPNQHGDVSPSYKSYADYLEYARQFLAHLAEPTEELYALGLSFGAEVIRDLNLQGVPFKGMVLCGVSPDGHEQYWRQYFRAQYHCGEDGGAKGLARFMAFNIYSSRNLNKNGKLLDQLTLTLRMDYDKREDALLTILAMIRDCPLVEPMQCVPLPSPALVLHGEFDSMVPPEKIEDYATRAGAKFQLVRNSGHMITTERFYETVKYVTDFFSAIDRTAALRPSRQSETV